jgi:nucleoside-diphosphate-sugar epimerase
LAAPRASRPVPPPVRPPRPAAARGRRRRTAGPGRLLNVLVVGGNRFVGYDLVWRLLAGGHAVTLFNRGRLADPFGPRVERLRGDRTTDDFERLLAGRRFDATVDFAAFAAADTQRVVRGLADRAGHYVLISTGQVYLVRTPRPSPAREEDYDGALMAEPPGGDGDHADWAYGMGKRAAEDVLAAAFARERFPSTRLRIPMVNGERDYHRRLEGYLWRMLDGGPLLVPDGGSHRVRHVYARDVARAIPGLLGRADTFGQAYNLCQEETPTLAEVLEMVAGFVGAEPRLVAVPRAELEAAGLEPVLVSPFSGRWMSFLDPGRARRELGFAPTPLPAYLGSIVAAFLAHPPETTPEAYGTRARELGLAGGVRPGPACN